MKNAVTAVATAGEGGTTVKVCESKLLELIDAFATDYRCFFSAVSILNLNDSFLNLGISWKMECSVVAGYKGWTKFVMNGLYIEGLSWLTCF